MCIRDSLQVLRRLVQCGGWKISACSGVRALTEVATASRIGWCCIAPLPLSICCGTRRVGRGDKSAIARRQEARVAIGLMMFGAVFEPVWKRGPPCLGGLLNSIFMLAPPARLAARGEGGREKRNRQMSLYNFARMVALIATVQSARPGGYVSGSSIVCKAGQIYWLCLLVGVIYPVRAIFRNSASRYEKTATYSTESGERDGVGPFIWGLAQRPSQRPLYTNFFTGHEPDRGAHGRGPRRRPRGHGRRPARRTT